MRVALAAIFQITNTFSRLPTSVDAFNLGFRDPQCDAFSVRALVDAIETAGRESDIEVNRALVTTARASGPFTRPALESVNDHLTGSLRALSPQPDALILIMSGALFDEEGWPIEVELVRTARNALHPGTPIIALLSRHACPGETLINAVDLVLRFQFDDSDALRKTARKALRVARLLLDGRTRPVSSLRRLPLLVPLPRQFEPGPPFDALEQLRAEFELQPGVLDASIFAGFPYADVAESGLHVLVTAVNDYDLTSRLADRLRLAAWDLREQFAFSPLNVEIAVHEAMLSQDAPVVILDCGDDPVAGADGDGTGLLWALIDLGAPEAALGVIVDPSGVERSIRAGVSAEVRFDIGGSIDRRSGYPINVTAVVRRVSDGKLVLDDNCRADVGRSVLLDVEGRHGGRVEVIITERAPGTIEPSLFAAMGVDLSRKRIVGIKSSGQTRHRFDQVTRRVLATSTPGITTPSFSYLEYQRVPRPMYPIDRM